MEANYLSLVHPIYLALCLALREPNSLSNGRVRYCFKKKMQKRCSTSMLEEPMDCENQEKCALYWALQHGYLEKVILSLRR